MITTTYRQIPAEKARPGDRVTITGEIKPPGLARGLYMYSVPVLRDERGEAVELTRAGVTVTVERPVATTTEEPQGIGAVVRAPVHDRVYVSFAPSHPVRWRDPYSALAAGRSWAEIIDGHGPVEVLYEGWVAP